MNKEFVFEIEFTGKRKPHLKKKKKMNNISTLQKTGEEY